MRTEECREEEVLIVSEDRLNRGNLPPRRGRPALRSPRPRARTTRTEVTSPMGEDDPHRGHLAHGRGRPEPRSPLPFTRMTRAEGEDDPRRGHLVHGQRRPAPRSPHPWAGTTRTEIISPMGEDRPPVGVENGYDEVNVEIPVKCKYVFAQQIILGQENVTTYVPEINLRPNSI